MNFKLKTIMTKKKNNNNNQEVSGDHSVMRRKVLSTLLLGAGTMALAACGGGSSGSTGATGAEAASSTTTSGGPAVAAGASAASAATASTPIASHPTATTPPTSTSAPTSESTTPTSTTQQTTTDTTGTVSASSFGVKADGTTNDTKALQAAIDGTVGQILLITGQCRIDTTGLNVRSNSHIRFASGASLKLLPHNTDTYVMLNVQDVTNVVIENATVDGSKELNSASSGEWGMGIGLYGASNVTLTSPTTINCWGDGLYFGNGNGNTPPKNVTVDYHHASGNRRQGCSIISVSGVTFNNPLWENTGGTAPQAGLDIEPNDNNDVLENIVINNPTTKNNAGNGISLYLSEFPGPNAKTINVKITNHTSIGDKGDAFDVAALQPGGYSVTGSITSDKPSWDKGLWAWEDWSATNVTVAVTGANVQVWKSNVSV
jgi:hypothetical protein